MYSTFVYLTHKRDIIIVKIHVQVVWCGGESALAARLAGGSSGSRGGDARASLSTEVCSVLERDGSGRAGLL